MNVLLGFCAVFPVLHGFDIVSLWAAISVLVFTIVLPGFYRNFVCSYTLTKAFYVSWFYDYFGFSNSYFCWPWFDHGVAGVYDGFTGPWVYHAFAEVCIVQNVCNGRNAHLIPRNKAQQKPSYKIEQTNWGVTYYGPVTFKKRLTAAATNHITPRCHLVSAPLSPLGRNKLSARRWPRMWIGISLQAGMSSRSISGWSIDWASQPDSTAGCSKPMQRSIKISTRSMPTTSNIQLFKTKASTCYCYTFFHLNCAQASLLPARAIPCGACSNNWCCDPQCNLPIPLPPPRLRLRVSPTAPRTLFEPTGPRGGRHGGARLTNINKYKHIYINIYIYVYIYIFIYLFIYLFIYILCI